MKRALLLASVALLPSIVAAPAMAAVDKPLVIAQQGAGDDAKQKNVVPQREGVQNRAQPNPAQTAPRNPGGPPVVQQRPNAAPATATQNQPKTNAPAAVQQRPTAAPAAATQNPPKTNAPAAVQQTQQAPAAVQQKDDRPDQLKNNRTPAAQNENRKNLQDKRQQGVQPAQNNPAAPTNRTQTQRRPDEGGIVPPNMRNKNPQNTTQTPAAQNPPQPADKQSNQAARRIDDLRAERKETREGNRTVIREGDRTIVREGNRTIIRHDETARFRAGGANVKIVQRGKTREAVITRPGGVRIVSTFDANGRLVRRSRWVNGREFVLIQNRPAATFIVNLGPPVIRIPRERYIVEYRNAPRPLIYETLVAPPVMPIERAYTLDEIRYNVAVRERMPRIDIDTITFDTGSWEVRPDQAQLLEPIADAMRRAIEANPNEVYLIEGFTDAVGSNEDNLSLSDRRAQSVAEILTQDFQVPPENMSTQGYGEENLKVETQGPEERNRRVTVQRITPLLTGQAGSQTTGNP